MVKSALPRSKKRKTPYKHDVKSHTRSGRTVKSYVRGMGEKAVRAMKKRAAKRVAERVVTVKKKDVSKTNNFTVRVEYVDKSYEHVDVNAPDYINALDGGIDGRKIPKELAVIRIRR